MLQIVSQAIAHQKTLFKLVFKPMIDLSGNPILGRAKNAETLGYEHPSTEKVLNCA